MKKILIICLVISAALAYGSVSAQNTATPQSVSSLIQLLQQQIANLKAQIQALQDAQLRARGAIQDVQGTLKLIVGLREGVTGDDVKTLQAILSADPAIYPEGLITGYFGRLTAQAVKRFQKKHGIEDELGKIAEKTLKRLNKELDEHPLKIEQEDDDEDHDGQPHERRHCAIIPPGHLIAPGWLRKHQGDKPIVPPCQIIPPGIVKLLDRRATTTPPIATSTPDTVPPVISQISAINMASTTTRVTWVTNEAADSKIWYSTSTPVTTINATLTTNAALLLNHEFSLNNLATSTIYFYLLTSTDTAGNTATSSQNSFTSGGQ